MRYWVSQGFIPTRRTNVWWTRLKLCWISFQFCMDKRFFFFLGGKLIYLTSGIFGFKFKLLNQSVGFNVWKQSFSYLYCARWAYQKKSWLYWDLNGWPFKLQFALLGCLILFTCLGELFLSLSSDIENDPFIKFVVFWVSVTQYF